MAVRRRLLQLAIVTSMAFGMLVMFAGVALACRRHGQVVAVLPLTELAAAPGTLIAGLFGAGMFWNERRHRR